MGYLAVLAILSAKTGYVVNLTSLCQRFINSVTFWLFSSMSVVYLASTELENPALYFS